MTIERVTVQAETNEAQQALEALANEFTETLEAAEGLEGGLGQNARALRGMERQAERTASAVKTLEAPTKKAAKVADDLTGAASKNSGQTAQLTQQYGKLTGVVTAGIPAFGNLGSTIEGVSGKAGELGGAFGGMGIAIGLAAGAIGFLAGKFFEAQEKAEEFAKEMAAIRSETEALTASLSDSSRQLSNFARNADLLSGFAEVAQLNNRINEINRERNELGEKNLEQTNRLAELEKEIFEARANSAAGGAIAQELEERDNLREAIAAREAKIETLIEETQTLQTLRQEARERDRQERAAAETRRAILEEQQELESRRTESVSEHAAALNALQEAIKHLHPEVQILILLQSEFTRETLAASAAIESERLALLRLIRTGQSFSELMGELEIETETLGNRFFDTFEVVNESMQPAKRTMEEMNALMGQGISIREASHERSMELWEEENRALSTFRDAATETLADVVEGVGSAFIEVRKGEKSLRQAIKESLNDWLKSFAKRMGLRALGEFAQAIAAAARQRYDQAAQHAAAGAAFTAVAFATGAGAAAAKGAAPQQGGGGGGRAPQADTSAGGGGGNTYVININTPTSTAEIGRDMERAQRASQRRFGSGRGR